MNCYKMEAECISVNTSEQPEKTLSPQAPKAPPQPSESQPLPEHETNAPQQEPDVKPKMSSLIKKYEWSDPPGR